MLRIAIALVCMATLILPLSRGATSGDEILSTQKLIEQLGSNHYAERTRAARMLQSQGPSVLPALRKALKHPDMEVRRRVQTLIPIVEAIAALEPKRVTLKGEPQPLTDVLKEIEKQTGYKLAADELLDETHYSLAVECVPFWEALERVGRATGRTVSVQPSDQAIHLKRCETQPPLVVLHGPFRLQATRFHEDRNIDFTKPGKGNAHVKHAHDHWLTLSVWMLVEPRFRLLSVEEVRVEVALDEHGKPLNVPSADASRQRKHDEEKEELRMDFEQTAEVLLARSSAKAKTIKELRGSILVKIVVERKPIVVTEKFLQSKGTRFQIGGDTLEITDARERTNGGYSLAIEMPPNLQKLRLRWHDRIVLEDAKGNRYGAYSWGIQNGTDRYSISVDYPGSKDPQLGPAVRLIMEDWVILHKAVPFVFEEVPLP